MIEAPHFSWPFRRGANGKVVVCEQGSVDHIMTQENVIVACPTGFRLTRPEFGWPFPTFRNAPLDVEALENALIEFGPRDDVTGEEWSDAAVAAVEYMGINVGVDYDD